MSRSRQTDRREIFRCAAAAGVILAAAVLISAASISPLQSAVPELLDPVSGKKVHLPAGERMTHLFFFATWCRTCLDELPRLVDLEARWEIDGYSLVLIAVPTRQSPERLRSFIDESRPPGRTLLDRNGALSGKLGVEDLPYHVVLDDDGKIVYETPVLDREVASVIEKLAREPRP